MKKARFYAGLIHLLDFLGWYRIIKWWRRRQSNNSILMSSVDTFRFLNLDVYPQKYPQTFAAEDYREDPENGDWKLIRVTKRVACESLFLEWG